MTAGEGHVTETETDTEAETQRRRDTHRHRHTHRDRHTYTSAKANGSQLNNKRGTSCPFHLEVQKQISRGETKQATDPLV